LRLESHAASKKTNGDADVILYAAKQKRSFPYASAQTRTRRGRYPVSRPAVHPPTPAAAGPALERTMSLGTILLIVVILILIGVLPTWPHAKSWGYGPSGGVGLVVVILLVLVLMGRL
jgi:hypothetical protein